VGDPLALLPLRAGIDTSDVSRNDKLAAEMARCVRRVPEGRSALHQRRLAWFWNEL
jgi:hypothetical protein